MAAVSIVSWLMTILTLIGLVVMINKRVAGFYLMIISNFFFIGRHFVDKNYPELALFVSYLVINSYGVYKWKR